ncbi:hypothetical protein ZWY2020_034088 [Hordeum vulgare]|nr:hypothetical protein ZWY2020_034088 [Hordeum vulgare]
MGASSRRFLAHGRRRIRLQEAAGSCARTGRGRLVAVSLFRTPPPNVLVLRATAADCIDGRAGSCPSFTVVACSAGRAGSHPACRRRLLRWEGTVTPPSSLLTPRMGSRPTCVLSSPPLALLGG